MLGLKKKSQKVEEIKEQPIEEIKEELVEATVEEIKDDQTLEENDVQVAAEESIDTEPQAVTALAERPVSDVATNDSQTALAEKPQTSPKSGEEKDGQKDIYDKFPDLAELMNTTVEQLKDEFFLFQVRKLMSRIGKVVVRFNVAEAELERIFLNAAALQLNQIMVSPVYLPVCERLVKKHKLHDVCVASVIDFPFGESSFKSKLHNVRDAVRIGADEAVVTLPTMICAEDNTKILKKQIRKVGASYKGGAGVLFNATDLEEEQIKRAMKFAGRSKVNCITFAFGEATLEEVKSKIETVNKYKNGKKIAVIANVDRAESVMELFKLEVDRILTPYADKIGEELVKRFEIKSVKLY